jgi:hypothetical protein
MQAGVVAGNRKCQPRPVALASQCRAVHSVMCFYAALTFMVQIALEFITVLAKIMKHASPLRRFRQ